MPYRKPGLLLAAAIIAVGASGAEPAAPSVTDPVLNALIEEALARNPALEVAREREVAALALPPQAASRPGPMLGLFYENDGARPSLGREPMTRLGVSVSQELPFPGKLSGRRRVAEADAAIAALDVERARLSLVASIKRAYYGLVLSRGLARLALQHRDVWREIQETARVRYASSAGPQQDLLRAQIEGTRLQALHAQHHAEGRARLAQLNALLSRAVDTPVETPEELPLAEDARTAEEIAAWSEAQSPEVRAAALGVTREERASAVARLEGKPDFGVQGGYMYRGSFPLMWQVGGSIALPSKARARAALAEARARQSASRAWLIDVRTRLRSAVEQRFALIQAAGEIAATYRDGLLPQADLAVRSALARYSAGQASQASVLEAASAGIEDRTDYLRILATRASEQARLEEASLDEPAGMDSLLMHGRGSSPGMGGMSSPPDDLRGAAAMGTRPGGMGEVVR
jgi:outer membrane protein, heavy metal efflux system